MYIEYTIHIIDMKYSALLVYHIDLEAAAAPIKSS